MMSDHQPVLLQQVVSALQVRADGFYVDATFGRGGHATAILERLGNNGRIVMIDRDPEAIAFARSHFDDDSRVHIVHDAFANTAEVIGHIAPGSLVDGMLLDLGVSSPQLDQAGRGFSFMHDGPLDMRMDTMSGEPVSAWLARASEREIATVIRQFGEQRQPRRIARAIVAARDRQPICTTHQLADLVATVVGWREKGKHPATRVFQAFRIFINDELSQLESVLESIIDLLAPGGRLCVISFHSLEDRIVKRFMRRESLVDPVWRGLPDIPPHAQPRLASPQKAIRASDEELSANPRSRSAVLRVVERLS